MARRSSELAARLRAASAPAESSAAPVRFTAFCDWLGVRLTPGQRAFARVAYDGEEPRDVDGARALFGDVDVIPAAARAVVVAVCGARAGKSYVVVALRLLHAMLVADLRSVAPGQRAVAGVIAPNEKLRREVVNYARGAVDSRAELRAMLIGPRTEAAEFALRRPDGRVVAFEGGTASAGGLGGRGRTLVSVALDECAFFRDRDYKICDEEIYRAASARVLPGGQTILASTPWARAGLLWEFFGQRSRPDTCLVAHAPTLVLHDSEMTRAIVERERRRDPENAAREFDAEFLANDVDAFFDDVIVTQASTDAPFSPQPGDQIVAGADFGFVSDSSALVLAAIRGSIVHVFEACELRPAPNRPLEPKVTVAQFAMMIQGRCAHVMADGHYGQAIAEHLRDHGLIYAAAPVRPDDSYVRARVLLRERRIEIHPLAVRERLLQQLRQTRSRATAGGRLAILHDRTPAGAHGDLVAALVLAVWQAVGLEVPAPAEPAGRVMTRARKAARIKEQTNEWWETDVEGERWA